MIIGRLKFLGSKRNKMKIRNGFVSNSSSSSFLLEFYDNSMIEYNNIIITIQEYIDNYLKRDIKYYEKHPEHDKEGKVTDYKKNTIKKLEKEKDYTWILIPSMEGYIVEELLKLMIRSDTLKKYKIFND